MALDDVRLPSDAANTGKRVDHVTHSRSGSTIYREISYSAEPFGDDLVQAVAAAAVLQELPTSPTLLISGDCRVGKIILSNTTAALRNVTITDGQGTPVSFLSTFVMADDQVTAIDCGKIKFTGGLKWSASASGVVGAVVAYQ